jgi:shikimate kinase
MPIKSTTINHMQHIILIGFKSVGKSAIGKELAKQIGRPFVDLDEEVQKAFAKKYSEMLNSRQIMLKIGQENFRDLEGESLIGVLKNQQACVVALGGGTPMHEPSRKLISEHTVVFVTAPKNIVYERIMINGRPAFFSPDEHPMDSFNRIWDEREGIYEQLAKVTIENSGTIEQAVEKIINKI